MKPVDQDEFYEANKSRGNCYAACIASILELPLEALREFHRLYVAYWSDAAKGNHDFNKRDAYFAELHRLGCHPLHFSSPSVDQFQESYGAVPLGYAIASGMGPRGVRHSVVSKAGVIVHDPHPSRAGLLSIESYEYLLRVVRPEDW